MSPEGSDRTGGGAFFALAGVILAGLLFAAGVMVGRNLARDPCPEPNDALTRADRPAQEKPPEGRKLTAPALLLDSTPRLVPSPPPPRPAVPDAALADAGVTGAAPDADASASPGRRFAVQVAAFKEAAQAQALVERLASRGYPEVRVSEAAPGRGAAFRVRAGSFTERERAEELARRLEAEERFKVLVVLEE
ncbi:MAG: SPOR domain-containing protein [Myxococcales bacterium]|nr:SPOR domain-containing protein [Myxococcales bacterium]